MSQEGGRGYITPGIRVIGLHCNQKVPRHGLGSADGTRGWVDPVTGLVEGARFAGIGVRTLAACFLRLGSWWTPPTRVAIPGARAKRPQHRRIELEPSDLGLWAGSDKVDTAVRLRHTPGDAGLKKGASHVCQLRSVAPPSQSPSNNPGLQYADTSGPRSWNAHWSSQRVDWQAQDTIHASLDTEKQHRTTGGARELPTRLKLRLKRR